MDGVLQVSPLILDSYFNFKSIYSLARGEKLLLNNFTHTKKHKQMLKEYIELMWQGFGSRKGCKGGLCREESMSCPMLEKIQLHPTPKGTHCWPKLSQ